MLSQSRKYVNTNKCNFSAFSQGSSVLFTNGFDELPGAESKFVGFQAF
jgi:hypothetical protein